LDFLTINYANIACSRNIHDLLSDERIDETELIGIVNYLDRGIPVIHFISDIYDDNNERIGPNTIYTDGLWIWPSYYSFYLRKYPEMIIPDTFRQHVKQRNHCQMNITPGEKKYVEYILAKVLNIRVVYGGKLPEEVVDILKEMGEDVNCY